MNTTRSAPPHLDLPRYAVASIPHGRLVIVLSGLVGMVCFANTLANDYCFDDVPIVRDNPRVNEPGQWSAIVTKDHWAERAVGWKKRDLLYRPVTLASYRAVRTLCGPHAFAQHLVNVLLHGVVCALVALICMLLDGSARSAIVAGVAFAVLPIHTEAVASVVGRADLLATVGVLGAMLLHGRSNLSTELAAAWGWRWAAATAALFAMGAKENGLAAAPMVVLADGLWHRYGKMQVPESWWHRRTIARLAYLAVPAAVYLTIRWYVLGGRLAQDPPDSKTINVLAGAAPWQHLLGVVQLWGMYWAKTIWPAVLTIKYSINGIRLATSPADVHVLIGAAALLTLAMTSLRAWRRGDRRLAFVSVALVVCYLPTSNALVLMQVFMAERIWYLPSVWLCLWLALLIAPKITVPVVKVSLAVLAVGMMVRCYARNTEWRSDETLYAAAYRDAPDSVGPLQLYGDLLARSGRYKLALPLLHHAIEIDLGFTNAYRSLGRACLEMGNDAQAVRYLQTADMQAPGHPPTMRALQEASSRLAAKRSGELDRLRAVADREPPDLDAELAYVTALRNVGRLEDALRRQRDRDARFANRASWQHEFAVTLVLLNQVDEAIERYRKSLALAPDEPQRIVELAMLLLERRDDGDLQEAERLSARAGELAAEAPMVLACQAEVAAAGGDAARAVDLLRRAARKLPVGHPRRAALWERAKALGDTSGEP